MNNKTETMIHKWLILIEEDGKFFLGNGYTAMRLSKNNLKKVESLKDSWTESNIHYQDAWKQIDPKIRF